MKKIFLFAVIFVLLSAITIQAQVTIGKMIPPDSSAVLQVISPDSTKGVLVPEMTVNQRDLIQNPADGLLIYNISEECFNYWNATDSSWQSLCGGIAKSKATADCSGATVYGTYMQGSPLNGSDYITLNVNVEKAGAYTISATTKNGYGFNASGTFLNPGVQQVTLTGQGSPTNESPAPGDEVSIVINGEASAYTCNSGTPVDIIVASANPTFEMNCGSTTVNGTYSKGVSLKSSNTITVSVTVTSIGNGNWSASTNTVDGIQFSGNGVFSAPGTYNLVLNGSGTPTSAKAKNMTISINSTGISKTCSATVNCVYTLKNILVMGSALNFGGPGSDGYGYALDGPVGSNDMVRSATNYGPSGIVKVNGLNITAVSGATTNSGNPVTIAANPTDAALTTAMAANPDIVVIGWGMTYSATAQSLFLDYLNNGGVMIIMNKYTSTGTATSTEAGLFSALFGTPVSASIITPNNSSTPYPAGNGAIGATFQLANIAGDPILNGPFGKLGGLNWGNDYFPAVYMTGIPANQIVTYSGNNVIGGTNNGGVTMFRHASLNLFWVGDGGFTSDQQPTGGSYASATIEPFATSADPNYTPVPKTGWGGAATAGGTNMTIHNAELFANVMAWAIQQAENNGINSK